MTAFTLVIFIALTLLSLLTAPCGVLLIWNRSTMLAEGLGHAALLGFALHLFFQMPLVLSIFLINLGICLIQFFSKSFSTPLTSHEGHLQVMTTGLFAFGLLLMNKLGCGHIHLDSALWGDLLGITAQDLPILAFLVFSSLLFLRWNFKNILSFLVDKELAVLEGLNVRWVEFTLWIFLAMTITIGLRYFGALLLPSILMAPALIVQSYATSPKQTIIHATFVSFGLLFFGSIFAFVVNFGLSESICIVSSFSIFLYSMGSVLKNLKFKFSASRSVQ